MSIRHLRTLLAIAERGSFAAAARDIHLTESAVSMQMKALEEELGLALFDRSKRPPVLTEAGRVLLPEAKELVGGYERLARRKDDMQPVEGHLRLGAVPSVITGILPGAIAAMRRKHPGVHVEITMALSAELVERVGRRRLDAAVVSELSKVPSGLLWSPFVREPLVLIAPPDAPDRPAGELLARLRAALRRQLRAADIAAPLTVGRLTVDLKSRSVHAGNEPVHLTPLEFRLLECLLRKRGSVVTQTEILREVWGPHQTGDTRGLRAFVRSLRQKLEPDPARPQFLKTEAGVGYRLSID
jgi:DNA-binding transcriptional LysR family regulator